MFWNYLKVAIRNIAKGKIISFIDILGLALGMACCILIYLFVRDEFSYDAFHANARRIFRVLEVSYNPDGSERSTGSKHPVPLGPALKADLPEVERYVRFRAVEHFVRSAGEAIKEPVLYADPTIFKVFSFPLLEGNPETALADLNTVVITERTAKKYFGEADPIGRSLQVRIKDGFDEFIVSGVAQNVPSNSSIQFDILLPFENLYTYFSKYPAFRTSWNFLSIRTYVELTEYTSVEATQAKLPALFKKYYPEKEEEQGGVSSLHLQHIMDIHLTSVSKPIHSYILSGIAFIILLIACINFMTLSIGRSTSRSLEVGLRKIVGAQRRQLLAQYWGEALMHSLIALAFGILLTEFFLPIFNDLSGKHLRLDYADNWLTFVASLLIAMFTGLVAGSYPALTLSSFRPVELLRKKLKLSGPNIFTRSLVVLQFALTVFLIISTMVMASQIAYTRSKDLGYNKDQIVVFETNGIDGTMVANHLRIVLSSNPGIAEITATSNTLGRRDTDGARYTLEGKVHTISIFSVEYNYLDFLGLQLLQGRNFDANLASDTKRSIIVNEALVRDFDLTDPIGKTIPGFPGDPKNAPLIIGVVGNYHFQSLYQEIIPAVLTLDKDWGYYNYVLVRIRPGTIATTIATLKNAWREFTPAAPFVYRFLDDQMQAPYLADQRWEQIVKVASFFAILIACLGLLGLTSLAVASRTKEVGIRKVLGAPVTSIIVLISKEFFWLVLIGNILGAPIAYFAMRRWLQNFAFRTEIGWSVFALAACLALFVALLTVSIQVAKAALANPVESLRYE